MTNNNRLTRTIMTWVLASITMLFSQTEVYTTDSHSMPLYENQNQQIIQLADDISRSQFSDYISSVSDVQIVREFGVHSNVFLLENVVSSDWADIKQLIENNTNVIRWIPAYYLNVSLSEESEFLISDRISVKFNAGTSGLVEIEND